VLVVEDDEVFAQAVRTLLEADGRLEVVGSARDGRQGVELAETLRPDVVLMDIVLPVMDGVEATREIRRRQPTIPVVGITGLAYEERALEVSNAGAVGFVDKSELGPDLVEFVVAAAHGSRRRRRGRRTSG
jgi:two-component system, NarL family, response regulator LiaR